MEPTLPYDLAAERATLGACLIEPDAIIALRNVVSVDDFYLHKHGLIYDAVLECLNDRVPPDIVTVANRLQLAGELDQVGGHAGLAELTIETPTAMYAEHYGQIVAELAARRRAIETAGRAMAAAYDTRRPMREVQAEFAGLVDVEKRAGPRRSSWRGKVQDGRDLWKKQIVKVPPLIDGILTIGTTVIHAPPKAGKSWLALNCAYAIASGGKALGHFQAQKAQVLYLDLEMSEDIQHDRLHTVFPDQPPPPGVHFVDEWPDMDNGFLEELEDYLQDRPYTRLIIVDTMIRIRPKASFRGRSLYDDDADFLKPTMKWAGERGISLVFVHHSRKSGGSNAIDAMSGSHGLSGSVDNILWLHKKDEDDEIASLKRLGRRFRDTKDIPLRWDSAYAQWSYNPAGPRLTPERRLVLSLLRERGPLAPKEVSLLLQRDEPGTRRLLQDMMKAGLVVSAQGRYMPSDDIAPMA